MNTYCIFLRGINVGGNKKVPMPELKALLDKAGYGNVQTLLASGNIIADSANNTADVCAEIVALLQQQFGFAIPVQVRTAEEIITLVQSDPFKSIELTNDIKANVTFAPSTLECSWQLPHNLGDKCTTTTITANEICFYVNMANGQTTYDAMAALEKHFGKNVTTRTWKTVQKMHQRLVV